MCYIIQGQIEGIKDMQNDMASDGCLPTGLTDSSYYRNYFMDCQECSEEMTNLVLPNLVNEGIEMVENYKLVQIDLDKHSNHYHLTITHEGAFIEDLYIPIVNDLIHNRTSDMVLAYINNNYPNALWF